MSHTGSLGGEARIWEGALNQAGSLAVEGLDEMIDTLITLTYLKHRGRRIALVGGGGAMGVFSSDLAYRWGLEIPPFSTATQKRLRELFPTPGNSVLNPLDTGTPALPLALLNPMIEEILVKEPIDTMVLMMLLHALEVVAPAFSKKVGVTPPRRGSYFASLLKTLSRLKEETGKDIVVVFQNRARLIENIEVESVFRTVSRQYQEARIPVYTESERALRGIRNAARLAQRG
jgi:hypothetical protein